MRIKFKAEDIEFDGELNDSKTSKAIYNKLPLEAAVDTWGDEIYFDIGVRLLKEHPTVKVKVGDIAYWPQGSSMCIFFGPTPISKDGNPKPASEVNLIGRTDCPSQTLKKVRPGQKITIEKRI